MELLHEDQVERSFLEEITAYPGGQKIRSCQQCGTCSGSCQMAGEMDYTPRKIIEMVRAGLKREVLTSKAIWQCVSCYACTVRCPRGIMPTELMYALRSIAIQQGYCSSQEDSAVFYNTFCDVLHKYGRIHEPTLMGTFAFKGNPFRLMGMAPLGVGMLFKGKLGLIPSRVANIDEVRKLMALTRPKEVKAS